MTVPVANIKSINNVCSQERQQKQQSKGGKRHGICAWQAMSSCDSWKKEALSEGIVTLLLQWPLEKEEGQVGTPQL